jgi:pyruvate dehydrogenase E2 component (dihydrolipoamide acetyltransferase)
VFDLAGCRQVANAGCRELAIGSTQFTFCTIERMDIKLPPLGEGADSGTVVNVFVKAGDAITKGQAILELENEKAIASVPADQSGTVAQVHVKAGDKISVGQRLLSLAGGAAAPALAATIATKAPTAFAALVTLPAAPAAPAPVADEEFVSSVEPAAAPTIRRLAQELGIDLRRVRGSEPGGRIVMADLREYIQSLARRASQPKAAPTAPGAAPPAEAIDFSRWGPVTRQPLSPLRQVIARRMAESWLAVPRVTQFDEADITAPNDLRKKFSPDYEKNGARLTLTPLLLKALVGVLKRHPLLNSSLDEAKQELVLKQYYHIGLAVDTDAGLIVPVVRNVDQKSLLQLALEIEALAQKARDRKVSKEELRGGTFTVSNQGGIGGGAFTPIVNQPEVAILGLGRGALKLMVRGSQILPRLMLPLALSYNHRVIDGALAARFVVDLVKTLENLAETEIKL